MYRNLFISIHEPDDATRDDRNRRARSARGSDPGGDFMQSDPDDPGGDFMQSDPDDPGGDFMQSDPDDPGGDFMQSDPDDPGSGSYHASGRRDVVGTVYAQSFAGFPGGCCCRDKGSEEPTATAAPSQDYSGFVIVRLAPDVQPLSFESLHHLVNRDDNPFPGLKAVLEIEIADAGETGEIEETEEEIEEPEDAQTAFHQSRSGRRPRRWGPRPRNWVGQWPPCKEEPLDDSDDSADAPEPPVYRDPPGVLRSAPLIDIPSKGRTATLEEIETLEGEARTSDFRPLHSLRSYWRVDLRPYPERVEEVVEALNRLREVDVAYRELSAFDSQSDQALSEDQGYLGNAPVGIGARWAWELLTKPPARILDLEQGWILDHKAFKQALPPPLYGDNRAAEAPELGQHGTAVLGQLTASQVVEGAVPDAPFLLASHYKGESQDDEYPFPHTNGHVAAAIVNALVASPDNLKRGDVLLLEVQRGRFPTEIDPADFDAIRLASALGIVVIEAAGNGNYDLDRIRDPVDGRTFRRGDARFQDSGAIFVGACLASLPHNRAPFSNFGSRVDCFAWGESVTTAGYGDLMGGKVPDYYTDYYTNTFSGTSSAAPVIAGAAALVQGLHNGQTGTTLRPRPLRALLSNPHTGVRQGPDVGGHIGVMPDLRRVVGGELQVVPQLYLRKRPGDEGVPTEPDQSVSSSPDILVAPKLAAPQAAFGSGSHTAHDPAPGEPLQPGGGREIYVRLCNRGGDEKDAKVHVFSAPVATLITPERWVPIEPPPSSPPTPPQNLLQVPAVKQGDTLAVSDGIPWGETPGALKLPAELAQAGWSAPEELYSLLAVLEPEDAQEKENWLLLPPGPPYFQWSAYRAFLRRRGVAWRNAHRVRVKTQDPVVLACPFAGTPDRERRFDFEVIQRLPQGAKVKLAAQPGLAAKLHQRQPWLSKSGDDVVQIDLPPRRSTRFSRVTLAAHAFEDVWLRIEHGGKLGWGHSVAVRQLWRGEEVGRITWHFAKPA